MELNLEPLHPSRRRLVLWAICVLWFSALAWWHRNLALDDAWITFRYARNLTEGLGWVFNPGEPLEGYSNFLWVLISAVAIGANVEPLGAVRLLGWLTVCGVLAVLIRGMKEKPTAVLLEIEGAAPPPAEEPPLRSGTAALLMAGSYPLAVWTMAGLETAVYAMTLLAALVSLALFLRDATPGKGLAAGLLFTALALSRPEGAMWGVLPLLALGRVQRDRGLATAALPVLVLALLFGVYTSWRLRTFGTIVPNTVTAKVGGGVIPSLKAGVRYTLAYFASGQAVALALAVVAIWRTWKKGNGGTLSISDWLVWLCGGAVALQLAFAVAVGGDWMPGARFFVPLIPPLCVLVAFAIRPWPLFIRLVLVGFFLLANLAEARHDPMLRWCRWAGKELGNKLITDPPQAVGEYLRTLDEGEQTLAATEAGIIPYASRMRFIDMLGLVDAHIAALPGGLHEKFDTAYVLARKPDYIALGFVEEDGGLVAKWQPDQEMARSEDFQASYTEIKRWKRPMDGPGFAMEPGWMVLYRRK